jgi:hypothetical protein
MSPFGAHNGRGAMSDLSLLCAPKRTFAASGFMGSRPSEAVLDQGCSLHHSGHLTLWGVRVAFRIIR